MAKRNGADPRQRQLGSIEAEVVSGLLPAGRPSAIPMSVAEFDGWDADDVRQWLDGLTGGFRQLRAVIGLGLWVLRDRTESEVEYTTVVRELAANFGVGESTLRRWRSEAQEELGLPDPKGAEKRAQATRAVIAKRAQESGPASAPKVSALREPDGKSGTPEIERVLRPNGEAAEQVVARDDTRRAEVQPPAAQAEGPGATGTTVSPRAPGSSSARGAEPPAPPSLAAALDVVVGYKPTEARAVDGAAFARFESWVAQAKAVRRQAASAATAKGGRCSHPKDREKKLPYGVFCGECETKIR